MHAYPIVATLRMSKGFRFVRSWVPGARLRGLCFFFVSFRSLVPEVGIYRLYRQM